MEVISIANVQKFTMANIKGGVLTRHFERAKDSQGNYHKWGNQEINTSISHLNYNLAPNHENGQLGFISERLSGVKYHKREDVNVMCSWVITAPKILDDSEHRKFFEESYYFLSKKYGEKNVISSYVHMDETTPHMHFAFVPVVTDKKKGHEKVSAKEALGWSEKGLYKFHRELDSHMTNVFGRDIGILNGATVNGNRTIEELKITTLQEKSRDLNIENIELENKNKNLKNKLLQSQNNIKELKLKYKQTDVIYKTKSAYVREYDRISDISMMYPSYAKISKKLFGQEEYVTVPKDKWEAKHISSNEKSYLEKLKKSYDNGFEILKNDEIAKRLQNANLEVKKLKDELNHVKGINKGLNSQIKAQEGIINNMNDKVNKIINQLPHGMDEIFMGFWYKEDVEHKETRKVKVKNKGLSR
jgi:predicted  nucleic acid-binding Zn-ribbon protein